MSLSTLRKLLQKYKCQILAVIIPLLFLPLPVLYQGDERVTCAYVLLWLASYQIFQVVPLGISSLLPLIMFPLLGVSSSKRTAAAYSSETVWVLISIMIFGVAFEKVKLHQRAAFFILHLSGPKPIRLLWSFAIISLFSSMVVSNVGAAMAIFTIVDAIDAERKKLIYSFQENNTEKEKKRLENKDIEDASNEVSHNQRYSEEQKNVSNGGKGIGIVVKFGCDLGGMASPIGTPLNALIIDIIKRCYTGSDHASPLTFSTWTAAMFPTAVIMMIIMTALTQLYYYGFKSFHYSRHDSKNANDVALQEWIDKKYQAIGAWRFEEVIVMLEFLLLVSLLIFLNPTFMTGWAEVNLFKKSHIGPVVPLAIIAMSLFLIPVANNDGRRHSESIMDWRTIKTNLPWQIVMLLGSTQAAAQASRDTGLQVLIKEVIEKIPIENTSVLLLVLCLIAAFGTEILTNVLMMQILIPIMCSLSLEHGKSYVYFAFPVAICINTTFMMPAQPVNTICLDFKRLTILQMITSGFIADLLFVSLITVSGWTWFNPLFDMHTKTTQSNFVNISSTFH